MVELCNIERLGWTAMTIATAIVAASPRLHYTFEHGKLRGGGALPTSGKTGRLLDWARAGVPKRLFSHFYLLSVATSALVFADVLLYGGSLFTTSIQRHSICSRIAGRGERALEFGAESLVCLFFLTLHSARRLWECVGVTQWGSSRMTLISYAVGIVHYQLMILTILVEAPPLGRLAGQAGLVGWGSVPGVVEAVADSLRFRHAAAVALYVVGCWRQHEAIVHLASLRGGGNGGGGGKQPQGAAAGRSTYAIPTAGWFRHVSCPHYLAELLVYASFVLLGGFKGRGLGQGYLVAFSFVLANQALVAGRADAWYRQKFEDYPRERKRLVPGVW